MNGANSIFSTRRSSCLMTLLLFMRAMSETGFCTEILRLPRATSTPAGGTHFSINRIRAGNFAHQKSTYRALINSRAIRHIQDHGAWSVTCFVMRPSTPAAHGGPWLRAASRLGLGLRMQQSVGSPSNP
jgi:hypothetical protein